MSAQRIDPTPAPSTAARGELPPNTGPAAAGPLSATSEPPPPPARGPLLLGCAALLAVAAVILALAFSLFSQLGDRPGPSTADRIEPDPAGGRLTRSERERLGAELAEVERGLAQAEGQARIATDPGVRDGWLERAAELAARRDALRARLGR